MNRNVTTFNLLGIGLTLFEFIFLFMLLADEKTGKKY